MMLVETSASQALKSVTISLGSDANGNITEYLQFQVSNFTFQVSTVAHYEYSPFGQVTFQSGDLADSFAFRYSTKYSDIETGLTYFNYRYYDAEQGRFISQDPIEESGGLLLYGYCRNEPIDNFDPIGMSVDWKPDYKGSHGLTSDEWFAKHIALRGFKPKGPGGMAGSLYDINVTGERNPILSCVCTFTLSDLTGEFEVWYYSSFRNEDYNRLTGKHEWGHTTLSMQLGEKYASVLSKERAVVYNTKQSKETCEKHAAELEKVILKRLKAYEKTIVEEGYHDIAGKYLLAGPNGTTFVQTDEKIDKAVEAGERAIKNGTFADWSWEDAGWK